MLTAITIGEIGSLVTFLVALIAGIAYLKLHLSTWIKNAMKEDFEQVNHKIDDLQRCIDVTDLEKTKNFLVARLGELDRGEKMDDIEIERFWEQYEHYKKHGGNSYIEQKVKKLQKTGKL